MLVREGVDRALASPSTFATIGELRERDDPSATRPRGREPSDAVTRSGVTSRPQVYEVARQRHPERWASGQTRAWDAPREVFLNPTKDTRLNTPDHALAA